MRENKKLHCLLVMLFFCMMLGACSVQTENAVQSEDMQTESVQAEGRQTEKTGTAQISALQTDIATDKAQAGAIQTNTAQAGSGQAQNEQSETAQIGDANEVTEELTIHFIDVGQGDCTLIICGEDAMLIDAGDNDQGTKIQNYLQKQNIETLKYVICTHPDSDHIGGMDVILYKFSCETVFMTEEEKDTKTYREVADTLKEKDYKKTVPVVGETYLLGDAEFTILGPAQIMEESNNNSIAILLTHGENKFLFTGDAEEEEELTLLQSGIPIEADVYKAGHHGSRTSSCKEFLEAVSPQYAVISCGEGNSYGHPHAEPLNNFRAMGIQVFRTDEQGSIVVSSDGKELKWNCSPSESWQAGEAGQGGKEADQSEVALGQNEASTGQDKTAAGQEEEQAAQSGQLAEITYICNTNTGKFHIPTCSSVGEMSEKNKMPVTWTREEVIAQGYVPCKRCKP